MLPFGRLVRGRTCQAGPLRHVICLLLCVFLPCAATRAQEGDEGDEGDDEQEGDRGRLHVEIRAPG